MDVQLKKGTKGNVRKGNTTGCDIDTNHGAKSDIQNHAR